MKRSIICILLIIIVGLILWFYFDNEIKKIKAERDAAIELAVQEELENYKLKSALLDPPVRTKIVYVEKEAQEKPKKEKLPPNTFIDERDGQEYKYVEFDDLLWMDENLNFVSSNSWCYDNNPENCDKWGRLYDWNAAKTACPEGWRLPKDEDWSKLISRFGGNDVAGRYLKVDGGSDFDILMAGYRDKLGFYGKADSSAYFWSGTEITDKYASFKGFYNDYANVGEYSYTKPDAFSVRCVKEK